MITTHIQGVLQYTFIVLSKQIIIILNTKLLEYKVLISLALETSTVLMISPAHYKAAYGHIIAR